MDVRIVAETTAETGEKRREELLCLSLTDQCHSQLGLKLEQGKAVLAQLQGSILQHQIEEISAANRTCLCYGRSRPVHDYRTRVLDTLFGRFRLRIPRRRKCWCRLGQGDTLSPLARVLRDRATPELKTLQAELGARHSFREAARILETFLPCAKQHNNTVRNRLGKVAKDITDAEPPVCETLISHPLTVFIDGAHIRCRPEYQKRHLDVVVGKIETRDMCRRFGLSPQAATSPAAQVRRDLYALGWDDRRPVTVISDGETALPNLLRGATNGKVKHILDWWHISMRVQHVENAIKGLVQRKDFPGTTAIFMTPAETLRWNLWHGNIQVAGTHLQWLIVDCARVAKYNLAVRDQAQRALARCHDLYSYLTNNMGSLVNYGKRYRSGLPISTSGAEGCVDDIGNARMGQRRRMRWSPRGAHNVST
ncbi:ISKra4 family transposase [Pseudooceanicola sp. C21-150M6]|uniref:ISKra4 family transposase n=1 Tax=Pseudooceanicola sp. C21-150M6 TaxID=3434355 RepID=UPI003D7FB930